MAAIALSDKASTLVGSISTCHFAGGLQYTVISATSATLAIQIQNTTDPASRGFITAFAFRNPSNLITGVGLAFNNTGMDVIGGPTFQGGIDCSNSTTSWGNADIGLSIGTDWNTSYIRSDPYNLRAGIRNWQIGVFQLSLTGTSLNTLSEASFQAATTSGTTPVFFPVHFMWLNDEQTSSGEGMVASN